MKTAKGITPSKAYFNLIERKNAELEAKWKAHFEAQDKPVENRLSRLVSREQENKVRFRESCRLDTLCAMER